MSFDKNSISNIIVTQLNKNLRKDNLFKAVITVSNNRFGIINKYY